MTREEMIELAERIDADFRRAGLPAPIVRVGLDVYEPTRMTYLGTLESTGDYTGCWREDALRLMYALERGEAPVGTWRQRALRAEAELERLLNPPDEDPEPWESPSRAPEASGGEKEKP